MAGACGGQHCLAGDGALNSPAMPSAKVILLLSPLNLKAANVKAVVLPQPWLVTAAGRHIFPPASPIFQASFSTALALCMDRCLFLGCMALKWEG